MNKKNLGRQTKAELLEEVQRLTVALQQERADLINSKQRFAKQSLAWSQQAQSEMLKQLLPILDNLQRAFALPPAEIIDQPWVKGILGIQQQISGLLKQLDVRAIEVLEKPFDPATMEAVATEPNQQLAADTVIEEIQRGYFYQDQVLRPAQVKVVKNN